MGGGSCAALQAAFVGAVDMMVSHIGRVADEQVGFFLIVRWRVLSREVREYDVERCFPPEFLGGFAVVRVNLEAARPGHRTLTMGCSQGRIE